MKNKSPPSQEGFHLRYNDNNPSSEAHSWALENTESIPGCRERHQIPNCHRKESTAALEGSASYRPYQLCSEESLSLEPSWQLWAEAEEHLHTVLRMQLGEVRDGTSDMFTSSALPISCSFTFEADWRSLGRPQPSHALYKGSSNALSSSRWDSASPRGWPLLDLGLLSQNVRATSSLKNIYDVWL